MTSACPQPVALDGLSGYFGNIGRLKNNYHFWATEYICTSPLPRGERVAGGVPLRAGRFLVAGAPRKKKG
jgi:hypothetical protein